MPRAANNETTQVPQLVLRIEAGPELHREFAFVRADRFVIGRARKAHFHLPEDDPSVSRHHCVIEICPPRVFLRDLDSTNGTYVNGVRVQESELRSGDRVRMGATVLGVELQRIAAPAGPDTPRAAVPSPLPALPQIRPDVTCGHCGARLEDALPSVFAAETLPRLCPRCVETEAKTGSTLGEYVLLRELGCGGMGAVHQAWHRRSWSIVAIKRLLPTLLNDKKAKRLFEREIGVLTQLRHAGIVQMLDRGTENGVTYLVSEYMDGGNLGEAAQRRHPQPLPLDEWRAYAGQILSGLEWAHTQGFVHRDIKPANLLLRSTGKGRYQAKVSDFGLAKSFVDAGESCLTQRGDVAGTLVFMAPEQILNYRYVKPPADVYSAGVSLYYLLTGSLPFHFPSPAERIAGAAVGRHYKNEIRVVLEDEPLPVRERRPSLPERLATAVDCAVRKDESRRYQTAREFHDAIEASFN